MFSIIRTLLPVTAVVGVMALLSPVAHAEINITRAEVQWDDAVVMGRGAVANDDIYWEGESEPVTRANKRGKFSFRGTVPSDCEGALRDSENEINVVLDNCTLDSGDPGGPDDPPGDLLELDFVAMAEAAHNGESVRAVGFVADAEEGVRVISGGEDALLRSWSWGDTESLEPELVGILNHPIYDFESSADVPIVVTGEGDWNGGPGSDTLRIWSALDFLDPEGIIDPPEAYPLVGTTAPIGFVYCVAISPYDLTINGVWTVVSGFYGEIIVYETVYETASDTAYETATLTLSATKKTKKKRTKALAFSPDGTILASTSTAGRIQLWSFNCEFESCELDSLPVSMTMSHGGSWVFPIAFDPYSKDNLTQMVSGSDGGTIKVWTIDPTKTPAAAVTVLPVASGAVYSLDWWSSPNGSISRIVAGGDGDITVYDASDDMNILFQAVEAHTGRVNDVAFSPDGTMIVSGGSDGDLKLWYLADP